MPINNPERPEHGELFEEEFDEMSDVLKSLFDEPEPDPNQIIVAFETLSAVGRPILAGTLEVTNLEDYDYGCRIASEVENLLGNTVTFWLVAHALAHIKDPVRRAKVAAGACAFSSVHDTMRLIRNEEENEDDQEPDGAHPAMA
jgi:hypothetical protein